MATRRSSFLEPLEKKMGITFKINKTLPMDISSSDTIASIKDKIFKFDGTPIDQQNFIFSGNRLDEVNKPISDYMISSGSTVDVHVDPKFKVWINIPSRDKHLYFDMKYIDTVNDLKIMIQDKEQIPTYGQVLVLSGKILKNNQLLIDCDVTNDSTVYLMLNPAMEVLIHIKMSCGETFSIEAMAGWTFKDLKNIIQNLKGVSNSRQNLLHNKRTFMDWLSLSDCKIQDQSILHLRIAIVIVIIVSMTGRSINFSVEDGDTVAHIISIVEVKTKLKKGSFKLSYEGKVLKEENTLAFYGIKWTKEHTILLCLPIEVKKE